MSATITKRQREMLAVARGLAAGLSPHRIATEAGIHPAAVVHHRRRLRHLRVTAEEIALAVKILGDDANEYLLGLFDLRRRQQKARSRAAKRGGKATIYLGIVADANGKQNLGIASAGQAAPEAFVRSFNECASEGREAYVEPLEIELPARKAVCS